MELGQAKGSAREGIGCVVLLLILPSPAPKEHRGDWGTGLTPAEYLIDPLLPPLQTLPEGLRGPGELISTPK